MSLLLQLFTQIVKSATVPVEDPAVVLVNACTTSSPPLGLLCNELYQHQLLHCWLLSR